MAKKKTSQATSAIEGPVAIPDSVKSGWSVEVKQGGSVAELTNWKWWLERYDKFGLATVLLFVAVWFVFRPMVTDHFDRVKLLEQADQQHTFIEQQNADAISTIANSDAQRIELLKQMLESSKETRDAQRETRDAVKDLRRTGYPH